MIERFGGEQIRFFLLRTHYRSTVVFSDEALVESSAALETFYRFFERYERVTGQRFYDIPAARTRADRRVRARRPMRCCRKCGATATDSSRRWTTISTAARPSATCSNSSALLNKFVDQHQLEDAARPDPAHGQQRSRPVPGRSANCRPCWASSASRRETASAAEDSSLVGQLMDLLIELRAAARKNKDFATADRIRDALSDMGVVLEDRKGGTHWRQL